MLSNSSFEKLSSFFASLLNYRETPIEKIYDPSSDIILVNGKQVSTRNNNSDINIIFPEFIIEDQKEQIKIQNEKNNITNNETLNKPNSLFLSELNKTENSENFIKKIPCVSLINNGIFPIFYITFALGFLIFLFLYEKTNIKSKDNYIQIGSTKLFVYNFFKLQNISHFIFHTFTFYTAIFGFCIVYIAFASVYAKNSILPAKAQFSKFYFYAVFAFGFFSNLLKFVSGILIFVEFPNSLANNANNHLKSNNSSEGRMLNKEKFLAYAQETVFNAEVYFTIAYGVLLFHFLKYFADYFEADKSLENANYNYNHSSCADSDIESLAIVPRADENINNISSNECSRVYVNENTSNYNKINNNNYSTFINNNNNILTKDQEENELNENLLKIKNKKSLPVAAAQTKANELLDPKWLKFKLYVVLYLFFMLVCFHLLKLSKNYFLGKTGFERNSYGMLKKHPVDLASVNYQYLVAFLPYGIYLVNSIFYFLNYGLLRNSQVKLFIFDSKQNGH